MNSVNTYRPINRTLAVIDGGLNSKVAPPPTGQQPKLALRFSQALLALTQYSSGEPW